jgi:hypothetical protein
MGIDSSKPARRDEDPTIRIVFGKNLGKEEEHAIVLFKDTRRNGRISVFDYDRVNDKSILFEFEKGAVDEKEVCAFVSASVRKHLQVLGLASVYNNFRHADTPLTFCDTTVDAMMEHVQDLVRFMLKASSLYVSKGAGAGSMPQPQGLKN